MRTPPNAGTNAHHNKAAGNPRKAHKCQAGWILTPK
uniref:Uncharacterized protein n=1 Tax=Arundo donax TaxID=35708 RepID=A0A0A9H560_ARUDO